MGEFPIRRGGLPTPAGFLYELTGGSPALDFANTVDERPTEIARELIPGYSDLLSWSRQAKIITPEQYSELLRKAVWRPAVAKRAHRKAILIRECLFGLFSAVASGDPIPPSVLRQFNQLLKELQGLCELQETSSGFAWVVQAAPESLDYPLWSILRSAADLLLSEKAERIRQCSSATCDWLFLDESKRGNRRWCDMTICGNRAKARRYYQKIRKK